MKKIFLILLATSGAIGLLISTGCVKDNVLTPAEKPQSLPRKSLNFTGFILPESNTVKHGTLTGIVLPLEAQARVYLFDDASNIELQLDHEIGLIVKNDIPIGEYSVYIQPQNLHYHDYIIDGVVINSDQTTDIGTITLDYYVWDSGGCEVGWGRIKSGK